MWEKNRGTTKCDKKTVTCNVGTAQYEDRTVKCDDLVTWYSRFPTSGYRTPFFGSYGRITQIRKKVGNARFLDAHLQPFDGIYTWL